MVAARFELRAKFREVVNLTIEDHPEIPLFVVNGLMPRGQINDAKPSHAKSGAAVHVDPFIVWSTVHEGLAHLMDIRRFGAVTRLNAGHADYATHTSCLCRVTSSSPQKTAQFGNSKQMVW